MSQSHDSNSCWCSNHWRSWETFIKQPQCNLSRRKTVLWLIANLSLPYSIWPVKRILIQSLSDMRAPPQYNRDIWKATHEIIHILKKYIFEVGLSKGHHLSFYLTLDPEKDIAIDTGQATVKFGTESIDSNMINRILNILMSPWPFVYQNHLVQRLSLTNTLIHLFRPCPFPAFCELRRNL